MIRRVQVSRYDFSSGAWLEKGEAAFLQFSATSTRAGAIIEWPDGTCEEVPLDAIRFIYPNK